jgi:ubiquinone/menaquinone biosynthesis C-methylase UbiE
VRSYDRAAALDQTRQEREVTLRISAPAHREQHSASSRAKPDAPRAAPQSPRYDKPQVRPSVVARDADAVSHVACRGLRDCRSSSGPAAAPASAVISNGVFRHVAQETGGGEGKPHQFTWTSRGKSDSCGCYKAPQGGSHVDILTGLNEQTQYSNTQLQLIIGAWVLSKPFEGKKKISISNGDVSEDDYDKQSIYALLYSLYRAMGTVQSERGVPYEMTFNTWGYDWPESWGPAPTTEMEPQRFGMNAYSGLFHFEPVKEYIKARGGKVHIVEMGCGTGAGAHHICKNVLPECTYQAFDMQEAAIQTAQRKHVPELGGRLTATRADVTKASIASESADFISVCETHVTEMPGQVTDEDRQFFGAAHRILKPGGYMVWGNAIPDSTWKPCFEALETIGLKVLEVCDVTKEAVKARDLDRARADKLVEECTSRYPAFRIPVWGPARRLEAALAMGNFFRNPGTNLYQNMVNGRDTYKVVLLQKAV